MIGLLGLIMLLLDEMVYVVKEMEWLDFDLLLLIGGVIIFKVYIVVKIEQNYYVLVVYVFNVSCVVGVCQKLLNREFCDIYVKELVKEYDIVCDQYVCKKLCFKLVMLEEVCVNVYVFDFSVLLVMLNKFGVMVVVVDIVIL